MDVNRINIISLLQLIASYSQQTTYQESVPFISVPNQMCCQWFDDFYHPDCKWFVKSFTNDELQSFKIFNELFNKHVNSLPETLEELNVHLGWIEISTLSKKILKLHGWYDLKL